MLPSVILSQHMTLMEARSGQHRAIADTPTSVIFTQFWRLMYRKRGQPSAISFVTDSGAILKINVD